MTFQVNIPVIANIQFYIQVVHFSDSFTDAGSLHGDTVLLVFE